MLTGKRAMWTMAAVISITVPVAVSAKVSTGTMAARVNVDTSCRLNTEPMTFGTVDLFSGQVDTTSEIRLSCGPAVAYSVAIDKSPQQGAVTIRYRTLDQLDLICQRLTGGDI